MPEKIIPKLTSDVDERIKELGNEQPWNHSIQLDKNTWTAPVSQISHGKNLVKLNRIKEVISIESIKNSKILDLGCNEGFFSFEMAKLGAKMVKGLDADELRIKKANFVKKELKISNVKFLQADVYNELSKEINYDFALCLGFLHRIPSPYDFLNLIQQRVDSILFEWKAPPLEFPHSKTMVWDGVNMTSNKYSKAYFRISINSLIEILKDFGFTEFKVLDDNIKNRPILLASRSKIKKFSVKTNKRVMYTKLFRRFFSDFKALLGPLYK